jgi:hypothetical protein
MGMLDGYRMVDIPESNNWLYSADAKSHGYWIWNKYCSSGAHLSGNNIVSCEAMTNTRGVFRMTLDMVKKNDDFNFITGINHSVLHGFNYSPPEADFPGWIRYGAYFSDRNSWWPYFRKWSDYNARLSALFQHAEPVTDIAIMTPEADTWSRWGLTRYPYYMNPWYHHDLWEGFSRLGITADYINEGVIRRGVTADGKLESEEATYQLVIVSSATSIEPETAKAIRKLAEEGVRFLFVEHFPSRSPGFHQKEIKDSLVNEKITAASLLPTVSRVAPPGGSGEITRWASEVTRVFEVKSSLSIQPAHEKIYSVKYTHRGNGIFFISSQEEEKALSCNLRVETSGKTLWRWDPETGDRLVVPVGPGGQLQLQLQPLESALLVLDDKGDGPPVADPIPGLLSSVAINAPWEIGFTPVRGSAFTTYSDSLMNFGYSPDPRVAAFAGTARYKTVFQLQETGWGFLDLGIQDHVTEAILNGKHLGTRWYGRHLYRVKEGLLRQGENQLEILYTTTLANYANSLEDNLSARRWIDLDKPESMGLTGQVMLLF